MKASGSLGSATKSLGYMQMIMEDIVADYSSPDSTVGGLDNVREYWSYYYPELSDGYYASIRFSPDDSLRGVVFCEVEVSVHSETMGEMKLSTILVK